MTTQRIIDLRTLDHEIVVRNGLFVTRSLALRIDRTFGTLGQRRAWRAVASAVSDATGRLQSVHAGAGFVDWFAVPRFGYAVCLLLTRDGTVALNVLATTGPGTDPGGPGGYMVHRFGNRLIAWPVAARPGDRGRMVTVLIGRPTLDGSATARSTVGGRAPVAALLDALVALSRPSIGAPTPAPIVSLAIVRDPALISWPERGWYEPVPAVALPTPQPEPCH